MFRSRGRNCSGRRRPKATGRSHDQLATPASRQVKVTTVCISAKVAQAVSFERRGSQKKGPGARGGWEGGGDWARLGMNSLRGEVGLAGSEKSDRRGDIGGESGSRTMRRGLPGLGVGAR